MAGAAGGAAGAHRIVAYDAALFAPQTARECAVAATFGPPTGHAALRPRGRVPALPRCQRHDGDGIVLQTVSLLAQLSPERAAVRVRERKRQAHVSLAVEVRREKWRRAELRPSPAFACPACLARAAPERRTSAQLWLSDLRQQRRETEFRRQSKALPSISIYFRRDTPRSFTWNWSDLLLQKFTASTPR